MAKTYLIHFYSEIDWIDFRYTELDALLELSNLIPSSIYQITLKDKNNPFLIISSISSEQILKICQRSVLIKHVYELYGGDPSLPFTHHLIIVIRGPRSGGLHCQHSQEFSRNL